MSEIRSSRTPAHDPSEDGKAETTSPPSDGTAASEPEAADTDAPDPSPRPRETRAARVRAGVEAILFSSPRPVSEHDLAGVLEATPDAVSGALALLAAEAEVPERGVRLERVGGGWRYVTRPEFDSLLRRFHEISERSRLSLAALETLAIIAYRQPITLPEVQEIRGVNSASVLKTLFDKKLVTTAGRKPVVGTPFLYKTTPDFLVRFGLNELEELPKPEEIEEDLAATVGDDAAAAERLPRTGPIPKGASGAGDREGERAEDAEQEQYDEDEEEEEEEEEDE